ncbi:MAG: helix-turn-helix transcriptional regulator [Bacteroidales bacterium]|nr:helix-turn-helix transcriptional regulator [Bacteroidales bacterium]
MSKATDFLNSHQSATPSNWRKNAQWLRDNERWLGYARIITVKVLKAMDEQSVTQAMLAERLGCTQQYVSNLLKGSSNMTLETIAKLESALQIHLWGQPGIVDGYQPVRPARQYLSDVDSPEAGTDSK